MAIDDHPGMNDGHTKITQGHISATPGHNENETGEIDSPDRSERLWNDSDYPDFPRPRGRGGARRKPRMRRIRVPKLRKQNAVKRCVICGKPSFETVCSLCKIMIQEGIFCPYCFEPMKDGRCQNPDCTNFEPPNMR